MEVPILKQGDFLIATVQAALTDADLLHLRTALVQQVVRSRSRGVIVDVTSLDVMDSFASRTLRDLAHMIRLRGAETVIVGIQPEVAFAMVQLGLRLEDVATALDLEEGLAYLNQPSWRGISFLTPRQAKSSSGGFKARLAAALRSSLMTTARVSGMSNRLFATVSQPREAWGWACPA